MKHYRAFAFIAVTAAAFSATAAKNDEDQTATNSAPSLAATRIRIKCQVCEGRGSLTVRPPDMGQHKGRIEGRSHWDIELKPCPVCKSGRGWRTVWDTTPPEPRTDPPCLKCGWSGLDPNPCRQCLGSGLVDCRHKGCKDGWIVTAVQQSGRKGAKKPPSVEPCPECKGTAKTVCPKCAGMRAEICKKCHGTGRKDK